MAFSIHATLVEIDGQGILLKGPSRIGKSELALALLDRGHCLIADDVVCLEKETGALRGFPPVSPPSLHIHDVGILALEKMYPHQWKASSFIRLVLNLTREPITSVALEPTAYLIELLDHPIPAFTLHLPRIAHPALIVEKMVLQFQDDFSVCFSKKF